MIYPRSGANQTNRNVVIYYLQVVQMHFNVLRRQAHLEIFRIYRLHKAGRNSSMMIFGSCQISFFNLLKWIHP